MGQHKIAVGPPIQHRSRLIWRNWNKVRCREDAGPARKRLRGVKQAEENERKKKDYHSQCEAEEGNKKARKKKKKRKEEEQGAAADGTSGRRNRRKNEAEIQFRIRIRTPNF